MNKRNMTSRFLSCAVVASFGAILFSPVLSRAALDVVAPREGSVVGEKKAYLIVSTGNSTGTLQVSLNGKVLPEPVSRRGGFSSVLDLSPGQNRIGLVLGSERKEFTLEFKPSHEGGYRYHSAIEEGGCEECHPYKAAWVGQGRKRGLCHTCHDRKDTARFLHGPVGAGRCDFCHDPHGSPYPAFLSFHPDDLCAQCHDQPESKTHLQNSSKKCNECHDPHGSDKKFFLL